MGRLSCECRVAWLSEQALDPAPINLQRHPRDVGGTL